MNPSIFTQAQGDLSPDHEDRIINQLMDAYRDHLECENSPEFQRIIERVEKHILSGAFEEKGEVKSTT